MFFFFLSLSFLSHWNVFLWFFWWSVVTVWIKKKMDATVAILETLMRLTNEVSKLAVVKSQQPRRQYKSRSPSPRHRRLSSKPGLCYYHSHFGAKARRCKMPCSFSNQRNLNLESWAQHTLHKIYTTTVPILSLTSGPKHVVWLTQEQLAVSGLWNSSLRSRQCRPSHCKR